MLVTLQVQKFEIKVHFAEFCIRAHEQFFSFLKDFIYSFLGKEEEREKEREKNINVRYSVASHNVP